MNRAFRCACLFLAFVWLLAGCGVGKVWYSKRERQWTDNKDPEDAALSQVVYLIGDAGNPVLEGEDPVFELLRHHLSSDSLTRRFSAKAQTVLFLGDNVYENGLPPEDAFDREVSEQKLVRQMNLVKEHTGKRIFIPGNHDWNHIKADGWEYVVRQQQFVEEYLQDSATFYPKGGCPGPVEVELSANFVLIIVDTNWWLTKYNRPEGVLSNCGVTNEFDFMVQFQNVIRRNRGRHKLITIHHPLYSNGNHGGYYSLLDYIFPLSLRYDNLYIPLPVVGSIYPLMRKYGVSRQDIPNPVYQKLKSGIMNILREEEYVVLASGHDHNLQLHKTGEVHHVVSGSASKLTYAVKGHTASFVAKQKGFSKLNYFDNGEVWVEFWTPDSDNPEGRLLYKKPLYAIEPKENPQVTLAEIPDYRDSTILKAAGREYHAKSFLKRTIMGTAYRQEWATPIKLQYLDMKTEAGGLTPLQRGGGQQTISLRVKGEDGNEYVLRSVNKDPAAILPEGLRQTFAEDIIQDQMSSSHPYGALAVPRLAEAVDIYHTQPKVVYIPFTPQLGPYLDEFGGMMALMEIRPDEDLSEFARFGESKNVVSTATMFGKLREDNDDVVDVKTFLRARLLDMVMNDWDRHDDQWRWSEFENDKGHHFFKPVPRDRDQVFAKYNGVLPSIIASKLFERRFTDFDHGVDDVLGMNLQALHLDRRLLFRLERKDWVNEVNEIQKKLTNEAIEEAIKDLPQEVYEISGAEIASKLKSRRDKLKEYALDYYELMAEKVDVVFTDKHEHIFIERGGNGDTRVQAWKRDLEPDEPEKIEQKLFDRKFKYGETEEVRIYCLFGRDSVIVRGHAEKGIKLRIVGGPGEDYILDESSVGGLSDNTEIYDFELPAEKNTIIASKESDVHTSTSLWVNSYDPLGYLYDEKKPTLLYRFDADYGFYLGGSLKFFTHGFRTFPYATMHRITAGHSFRTGGFNFEAEGDYPMLFGRQTGLNAVASVDGPGYVINYFGLGNETVYEGGIHSHRIKLNTYRASLSFVHRIGRLLQFDAGPAGEYVSVEEAGPLPDMDGTGSQFLLGGGKLQLSVDLTNNEQAPTRGLKWQNRLSYLSSLNGLPYSFGKFSSDASFYLTPNWAFRLTMVYRAGVETNFGEFPFYHAAFLGGNSNLRGFRMNRFAGQTAFYQTIELRPRIDRMQNYLVTGEWGLSGFADNGKVWVKNEVSDEWHDGYGGGVWVRFYDLFIISGGVGFSKEGTYFRINSGFFF